MTIPDYDTVGAVHVEDHVVVEIRWVGAGFASTMPKLGDVAKRGQSTRREERAGPFLQWAVSGTNKEDDKNKHVLQWNVVEWFYGSPEYTLCTLPPR